MKWEEDAREIVDAIPVHEIIKNMIILWAERCARKANRKIVTAADMARTRDDYFEWFGEEKIEKIQQARDSGQADADLDPEIALNKDPALYKIELCHSRFFGCDRDLVNVRKLGPEIKKALEKLKITEILADKAFEVLMPHSVFTVSVSGCGNLCTGAESKDIGIHGAAKPKVTDKKCILCKKCAHACLDRIISFEEGRPVINEDLCRVCGNCIKVCPTGAIVAETKGCRILAGGAFGRFARHGVELFRVTPTDTMYPVLEAAVELIKKNLSETHEDNFSLLLQRTGIAPIFDHLANRKKVRQKVPRQGKRKPRQRAGNTVQR